MVAQVGDQYALAGAAHSVLPGWSLSGHGRGRSQTSRYRPVACLPSHRQPRRLVLEDVVRGRRVIGVGWALARCASGLRARGGSVEPFENGAHTVRGSAGELRILDASFDAAIMDTVLEQVPDASMAFRKVARVLRPGGVLMGFIAVYRLLPRALVVPSVVQGP